MLEVLFGVFGMIITYIVMCGTDPSHSNGCVGWLHKLIIVRAPNWIAEILMRVFPAMKRKWNKGAGCIGVNGPCHYLSLVIFTVIYGSLGYVYFKSCYKYLKFVFPATHVFQKCLIFGALPMPWIIFLVLQKIDPGEITEGNVEMYLRRYPYDDVIYQKKECSTLGFLAPARSRYCRFTRKRIARYDHYCPWLLRPIGERNYNVFMVYMLVSLLLSGTAFTHQLLQLRWIVTVYESQVDWGSRKIQNAIIISVILLRSDSTLLVCTFWQGLLSAAVAGMLIQHIYHISVNVTHIEAAKIKAWKATHAEPYVHKYDRGLVENWKEILFPPKSITYIKRRKH